MKYKLALNSFGLVGVIFLIKDDAKEKKKKKEKRT